MLKITGIDHIVLRTSKIQAMLHFYCQVLGCSIERETANEIGLIQLRAGNALIDLVTIDGELGKKGGAEPTLTENNLDHFCLQLNPISEIQIKDHLQKHGIRTDDFAKRYGAQGFGRSIYIKDPQGNLVELRSQII